MRQSQNTNNVSRLVRVVVNGKKYLVRYKDIKEYMNLLIEDNILWGYKSDCSDEEIRDYQNSATLEFKQLRHAINQNPDIVLTLDESTESFVVATDRNTGQDYGKHIPIDYVLADDDWTPIPRSQSPISETKPKKSGGVKQWLANHPEAREDLRMLLEKGNPKKEAIEEFREKYGVDDLDMPAMRNVVRSRIEKKKKQQTRKWFANHPEAYADLYILFANGSPAKKKVNAFFFEKYGAESLYMPAIQRIYKLMRKTEKRKEKKMSKTEQNKHLSGIKAVVVDTSALRRVRRICVSN